MGGLREDFRGGRQLDDAAGVHHRHLIRERRHDGQVVGHVQGGDTVLAGQVANRLEHVGLGGHIETGRRLVEHDHRRPSRERHRQPDPLLLTTRQLVRVATQERGRGGQLHLFEHLGHPGLALGIVGAESVGLEHLEHLTADPQRGVQRGSRILGYVADQPSTSVAQRLAVELEDVGPLDRDRTRRHRDSFAGVPEHGEADGGLARA